ncbi:unnamed protein product [Lasius platythorax]|uniref:Uncharacterized protein n=1 Tax=Lasius platythorax TaxID=488582 RepID=A0AAV2N1U0_9HYME
MLDGRNKEIVDDETQLFSLSSFAFVFLGVYKQRFSTVVCKPRKGSGKVLRFAQQLTKLASSNGGNEIWKHLAIVFTENNGAISKSGKTGKRLSFRSLLFYNYFSHAGDKTSLQ